MDKQAKEAARKRTKMNQSMLPQMMPDNGSFVVDGEPDSPLADENMNSELIQV